MEVWSKVMEHGSSVGEAIREANFVELTSHLAQTIGWVLVFFDKASKGKKGQWGNLSVPFREENWDGHDFGKIQHFGEIVLYHYPAICSHCLGTKCDCALALEKSPEERLSKMNIYRNRHRGDFDMTWSKVEERFGNLYGHDDKVKSHADIGFHFLEEIGEVVKALRMVVSPGDSADTSNVESPTTGSWPGQLAEEIADVISWSTSVIRRVRLDLENYCRLCPGLNDTETDTETLNNMVSIEWALQHTYLKKGEKPSPICPQCEENPCNGKCDEF